MHYFDIINTFSKRSLSQEEKIKISKFYSELDVDGEKEKICLLCGEKINGFCKSHSLPKFVLKNHSSNGKLKTGKVFQSDSFKDNYGIENTLVFRCICDKCDSSYFQEYEKDEAFKKKLSDVTINEIAVKNYLQYVYKQRVEIVKNEKRLSNAIDSEEERQFYENQLFLAKLNLIDVMAKIKKYKNRKNEHNFYVIDEINLDYHTEIAYQGFITIVYGLDGKVINNIYDYDSFYKIQELGLSVIPHSSGTKIILFCEEGSTRLRSFYKPYKKLNIQQKLYLINYLLLLYEEEWTIDDAKRLNLNKETLRLINQHDTIIQSSDYFGDLVTGKEIIENAKIFFKLQTNGNIYNFLEKK